MKAYYKTTFKSSESSVFGEIADPVADSGRLLIEVKAVSINPVDYKLNKANTRFLPGAVLPKIVGTDFAGVVVKAVEGDTRFNAGDKVYGATPIFFGKPGALAEFLVTDVANARHIPEGMSFIEAASLPVAALTALNGLRRCNVKQGTRLLINGATGGVGHFAVQLARVMGAHITATCSDDNKALAIELGADEAISYNQPLCTNGLPAFDAIFDAWGKMRFKDYSSCLKKGGTYASPLILYAPAAFTTLVQLFTGIRVTSSNMRKHPGDYEVIEDLFEKQKLKPLIAAVFPFEQTKSAFEMAEWGRPRGKVVVTL
jgi:NADPH:quinone reductase-like Zn-dependent oxidoreductase